MKTYVALFRGINVGGKHSLPMKELVSILEDLGAEAVKTYIQSGNAVFSGPDKDTATLAIRISQEIKKRRGFEPHVLLLTMKEFESVMKKNPFPEPAEDSPQTLHAAFLASKPKNPNLKSLEALKSSSERFQLVGNVFYMHAPDGIGRSKLAGSAEKLLGVPMTDRNWRTVCKIWEMAQEVS